LAVEAAGRKVVDVPRRQCVPELLKRGPHIWYEQARLAVEYDGDWHRYNLVEDNRRQNLLLDQGIRLLRFTASDVFQRPEAVAAQVRGHL